jgi:hypothetical protein
MKSVLSIVIIFLLTYNTSVCQIYPLISEVDFRIENNQVVVNYSISNYQQGQSITIRLIFLTGDNKQIIPSPANMLGDIGPGVPGGANKSIVWNIGNDNIEYTGMLKAVVQIVQTSQPVADMAKEFPAAEKERGTGGPGYAGLSIIFPGLGGYFVEKNTSRAIGYNVIAAAVLTSIIVHKVKLTDLKDQFSSAPPAQQTVIQSDIDKTEETLQKALIAYGFLWVSDILWVGFKGVKNKKTKELNYNRFTLEYSNNTLLAGYRVRF